jgi:hypothetical protein
VRSQSFDTLGGELAQPAGNGVELGPDGLPRRVRQANLAPQLRAEPSSPPSADPLSESSAGEHPREPRPPRTPDQYRATMSAFQSGFTRGRAEGPADDQSPAPDPAADERDARGEDAR